MVSRPQMLNMGIGWMKKSVCPAQIDTKCMEIQFHLKKYII